MNTFRLARIAAEAEGVRLRYVLRRHIVQIAYGLVAAVFVLAALAVAHFLGYLALRNSFQPISAAAIVLGVDVLLAVILGVVASMKGSPGSVERDALQVRKQATVQMAQSAAMMAVARPLARALGIRGIYGLGIAALTARFLGTSAR